MKYVKDSVWTYFTKLLLRDELIGFSKDGKLIGYTNGYFVVLVEEPIYSNDKLIKIATDISLLDLNINSTNYRNAEIKYYKKHWSFKGSNSLDCVLTDGNIDVLCWTEYMKYFNNNCEFQIKGELDPIRVVGLNGELIGFIMPIRQSKYNKEK